MDTHSVKTSMSLETSITLAPTSTAAKSRLVELLWGACPAGSTPTSYFEYYGQQCDSFSVEQRECCPISQPPISGNAVRHVTTHQDLAEIARLVAGSRTREEVVKELLAAKPSSNDEIAKNSINWAARALTCTEIGSLRCAFSSRRPLLWESGSLRDFLTNVFSPRPSNVQVRLEKTFNARNLERFAGISIEWTNDLSSHLSLRDDDTKLLIFHQATFLETVRQ